VLPNSGVCHSRREIVAHGTELHDPGNKGHGSRIVRPRHVRTVHRSALVHPSRVDARAEPELAQTCRDPAKVIGARSRKRTPGRTMFRERLLETSLCEAEVCQRPATP
jgi:hypothetical protein